MEATVTGSNRTGALPNPEGIESMLEAVNALTPLMLINTARIDMERQQYIREAESIGSIPPMMPDAGEAADEEETDAVIPMGLLLDKLGERIAFERTGTRLYGALITKYLALTNAGATPLLPAALGAGDASGDDAGDGEAGESALDTLTRIRAEELEHFRMVCDVVEALGGDPTAQTPCADVTAAASIGLMQVLTDPRTTLAQCLNTMLTAELADTAGWELLSKLAEAAGQEQLLEPFATALAAEAQHVEIVRGWLEALLIEGSGTPAV